MNTTEFINEVKNSDICPDNFDTIYREFQSYQMALINTLNELHRVCSKNGIHYQLAFGSLLGAVRDEGQIPWDYDIDVLVPYQEKDHLISSLCKDVDSKRFYFTGVDVDGRNSVLRMAPLGCDTQKLHVDIFYLIGTYGNEEKREYHEKQVRQYFHWRNVKNSKIKGRGLKRAIRFTFEKLKILPFSFEKINKRFNELCLEVDLDKTDKCIPVINGAYDGICFETKEMLDVIEFKTQYGEYFVPKDYCKVLSIIYKDYRKIYPLENRLKEMLSLYQNITGKKVMMKSLTSVEGGRYYTK